MEEATSILTEVRGNIGIITLNRPEVLNAVNLTMLNELAYQVQTFDYDENIRVIIIRGNDKAFAAGIDVKELCVEAAQQSFALNLWREEFNKIASCSKPLIAEVSGYALGIGCELALACDIIIASQDARFAHPEVSLGVIPAFGGCSRLVHSIGKAKTMEMILTGRALSAEEAMYSGLISRVIDRRDLHEEAIKIAMRIVDQPFQGVIQAKETINQVANMNLQNGIGMETKTCKLTLNTPEFKQQLEKFVQKSS